MLLAILRKRKPEWTREELDADEDLLWAGDATIGIQCDHSGGISEIECLWKVKYLLLLLGILVFYA